MSASMNAATALVESDALRSPKVRQRTKIEGRSPWRLGYERLRRGPRRR